MPWEEGDLLKGRYEIQSVLGRGGFATTYLAFDRERGRQCVVKALELRQVDTVKTHELFEREAEVLSHLDHPRVPDFIDFFTIESEQDIEIFLVQEHFEGKNLAQLLAEGKHFTEKEALNIALGVTSILEYLHSLSPPIIHRDIKPSNILLSPSGEAYLIDFGAVRDKTLQEPLLQPGGPTVVGTYGYMPLEQFEGQAGPTSDIYSLGATLVHLLTRKEPWALEKKRMRLDFRRHVHISRGFTRVLERMLEPDWKKRYPSASELRTKLEALGETRKISTAGIVGAVATAVVVAILILWRVGSTRDEENRGAYGDDVTSWWTEVFPDADSLGDPLPAGAILRLGTARLRHGEAVYAVAFSPDGRFLASGGDDRVVRLWDTRTGKQIQRLETYRQVRILDFSPDGRTLLSGGYNSDICVWNIESGTAVLRIVPPQAGKPGSSRFVQAAFSPDGSRLATLGLSSAVQVWNAASGEKLRQFSVREDDVRFADWIRNDRLLSVSDRGVVEIVDVDTGRNRTWNLDRAHVPLAISKDGLYLATASSGKISIREPMTGKEIRSFATTSSISSIASLAFSADGRWLAGGGAGCWILIWDLNQGDLVREITCPTFAQQAGAQSVAFSPDGKTLAAGCSDGSVRLWDVESGREQLTFPGHRDTVAALAFSPDGKTLVSGGADRSVRYWDTTGSQTYQQLLGGPVRAVAFQPEGRLLACEEDRYHVWDSSTRWEVLEVPFQRIPTASVAVSPQGRHLALPTREALLVYDVATGTEWHSYPLGDEEHPLAFSFDGSLLASRRGRNTLVVRDNRTGREIFKADQPLDWPLYSACFSPDGRFLASDLTLWNVGAPDSNPRISYRGTYGSGSLSTISPDGNLLAVRSTQQGGLVLNRIDRTANLTAEKIGKLGGHEGVVTALAFSPDSKILATGSQDTTILLWDVTRPLAPDWAGRAERPLPEGPRLYLPFDGKVEGVGVTPLRMAEDDGTLRFVSGKKEGALRLDGALEFPETDDILLSDSYTVEFWFRLDDGDLWKADAYQSLIYSDLLSFDVRQGKIPYLFISFVNQGGHATVDLFEHVGRLLPDRWYHFAVVHTAESRSVFFDGHLVVTAPADYGTRTSDRIGPLRLGGRGANGSLFQGALDELAVYDYARSADQIAQDALLSEIPESAVETADSPPGPMLAEAPILPDDVSPWIETEKHEAFTTYRLTGPLSNNQVLDLDTDEESIWVGTDKGLVHYQPASQRWVLHGVNAGIPGERVGAIAATGRWVAVDTHIYTGPHSVSSKGVHLYDPQARAWNRLMNGFVWDLHWGGQRLWIGTGEGVEVWDLDNGLENRYTTENSGLLHEDVHAVRVSGDRVWFAMLGDHVKEIDDFRGGGVSVLDRLTGRWWSYSERDGLARAYCCDLVVGESDVWVAHWEEEVGLSRFDLRTERWTKVRQSKNGIDLGGVRLALDGKTLWIGQQGGLVRLETDTLEGTLYTEKDGLPGYIVSGIGIQGEAVWASAYAYGGGGVRSSGVVRIPRK